MNLKNKPSFVSGLFPGLSQSTSLLESLLVLVMLSTVFVVYYPLVHQPLVFDSIAVWRGLQGSFNGFTYDFLNLFGKRRVVGLNLIWAFKSVFGAHAYWLKLLNVGFHLANTLLVYCFIKSLLQIFDDQKRSFLLMVVCAVGALSFGLNPVGMYAVSYVAQLPIVLAVFFSLLTLVFYLKGLQGRSYWLYLSAASCLLALQSKEHVVMLPVILVLLTFAHSRFNVKQWLRCLLPLVFCFASSILLIFLVKNVVGRAYEPGSYFALENLKASGSQNLLALTQNPDKLYKFSLLNQMRLYFYYLYLWFVPDGTKMASYIPMSFHYTLTSWTYIAGVVGYVVYGGVAALILLCGKRYRLIGFLLLMPWLMFMTELSTVRYHESFVLYRAYGWLFLWGGVLSWLLLRLKHKAVFLSLSFVYLLALIVTLNQRAIAFESRLDFWKDAVAHNQDKNQESPAAYMMYYNYGSVLAEHMETEAAIEAYQQTIKLNPSYVKGWYGLGAVQYTNRDYKGALKSFLQALKVNQNFKPTYFSTGQTYNKLGDYKNAILYLHAAAENDPESFGIQFHLGAAFLKDGQFKNAIKYFKRCVQIDSENAKVWEAMGVSRFKSGEYELAYISFENAYKLDSDLPDIQYNLGLAAFSKGNYDKAELYLREAVQKNPNSFKCQYDLASILMMQGKNKEAGDYFKASLQLKPDDNKAWERLGKARMYQGDWAGALPALRKIIERDPKNKVSHYNIGTVYSFLGDTDKAIEHLNEAIALDSNYTDARFNIGNLHFKLKEYSKAVQHFDAIIKIDPFYVSAYQNLGIIQAYMGYHTKAVQFYKKVIELKPDHEPVHFNLANSLMALGLFNDAQKMYQKVLVLNPNHVSALQNLGLVLQKLGRKKEAKAYFSKSLKIKSQSSLIVDQKGGLDD